MLMKALIKTSTILLLIVFNVANSAPITSSIGGESKSINLSLPEAIYLSLVHNPNIKNAKLNSELQKLSLRVQQWQFAPHYNLQATYNTARQTSNFQPFISSSQYNVQPGISLLTSIGTQVNLAMNNPITGHYNPSLSLQITQPLIKGFGKPIVQAALNNAIDNQVIAELNIKYVIQNTINNVINAYLDYFNVLQNFKINAEAVNRSKKSLVDTKLYIKAGHKAGNELITAKAELANAETNLENIKSQIVQAKYNLLLTIGINPNANINFQSLNIDKLIRKYSFPTLKEAIAGALASDIQFQTDKILLHGADQRSLLIARDSARWQLNFTANGSTGGSAGGGPNAGWNSIFNGVNQMQSVGLSLIVPIDDKAAELSIANAKVALQQAELAFEQEAWNKKINATNAWNNVRNNKSILKLAANAEKLQVETYQLNYEKYLHGLIDGLELQTAQAQLRNSQQTLLNSRVAYLKSLATLDLIMGNPLRTWNINLNLGSQ